MSRFSKSVGRFLAVPVMALGFAGTMELSAVEPGVDVGKKAGADATNPPYVGKLVTLYMVDGKIYGPHKCSAQDGDSITLEINGEHWGFEWSQIKYVTTH